MRSLRITRLYCSFAMLAAGACLLGAAAAHGGSTDSAIRNGGTFRISFPAGGPALDFVDPALSYTFPGWALLDAACARLMRYPDKPPPEGFRLVPDVAAAYPRVSSDGKTYTFTLRGGFRFSNGAPVRASAFARAINRTLAPAIKDKSPGSQYTLDVVGADAVQGGTRPAAAGIVARGNSLVIRLKRPVPDFPARTTMPFFCAVPPNLPADPEGVTAFPGAGPYYVAEYVRGRRVLLKRNRYYGGTRPRHVDQFVADLQANALEEVLDRIERGAADWGLVPAPIYFQAGRAQKFRRKYGINRSRFFVKPGLAIRLLVLNTSRPLFGNNARLRRAVNFAVDRPALVKAAGGRLAGTLTDQYLPPSMPGFRDAHIYPVARPNVQRARALARWHTRSKRAVLYTFDVPDPGPTVAAQIVRNNLAKIGLQVEIKKLPPEAYFNRVTAPNEPFDIALYDWGADYVDPFSYLNLLLDGRFIGGVNWSRFNSAKYNRLMRRAARLKGLARYRRYGSLDVQLARGAAPMVAVFAFNEPTLVSKRVDRRCIVLRPTLDLTAVCLKR